MPVYFKALVAIFALASLVFAFAKAPACAQASSKADFERRRNLWIAVTLAAFLAHDFWIFIIVAVALLLVAVPKEPNKLALFLFLLFAVPRMDVDIPGFAMIRTLFPMNYYRLLSLTVLLPAFLYLWQQPESERFGRSLPDKLIAGYLLLGFALTLSASTVTHALRSGFLQFIDVFLLYYVASRAPRNLEGFRDALMALVVAAMVISAIAVFEFASHWLLYADLNSLFDLPGGGLYRERGEGTLRAVATAGHAIPLGYAIAVASGVFLYLRPLAPSLTMRTLGHLLLIAGLAAPLSRGPWIGAAVMFLAFVALGPSALPRLTKIGLAGLIVIPVLLALPIGEKIIDLLPFVGSSSSESVTYRQLLLEIAIGVVFANPFFGAYDVLYSAGMQDLRQGEGIIDIVNTYLGVALSGGLVSLGLFAGFFVVVAFGLFRAMRILPQRSSEAHRLGQALLATLVGILVIIATTSSVSIIPVLYWTVAGLCVAYARMLEGARATEKVATPTTARTGRSLSYLSSGSAPSTDSSR